MNNTTILERDAIRVKIDHALRAGKQVAGTSQVEQARIETAVVWAHICDQLLNDLHAVECLAHTRYNTYEETITGLRDNLNILESQLGVASYTTIG
jgi:hypothetical protein